MTKEVNNSLILEELHQDEEELHRDEKRIKLVFVLIIIFILFLIAGVSYLVLQSLTTEKSIETIVKDIHSPASITPEVSPSSVLLTPTSAPTIPISTPTEPVVKDYYVNIGYGTNQSTDWTDVGGAITTADLGQYQNVKEIHFEAFINVPTANGSVSVRLLNKTDGYAVWNSEITRDSTAATYQFISPALIYDKTPKLYQVQMKSQLNVQANLVSSRIHIVAK